MPQECALRRCDGEAKASGVNEQQQRPDGHGVEGEKRPNPPSNSSWLCCSSGTYFGRVVVFVLGSGYAGSG